MQNKSVICIVLLVYSKIGILSAQNYISWTHGKLRVSEENHCLQHEDGTPFFWLGETGWLIAGTNGERYDRAIATRGNDYLLVYNYTGRPMQIDLSKISGIKKNAWWYSARDGRLNYIGEFDNKITPFQYDSGYASGNDHVLVVVDAGMDYIGKDWVELPDAQMKYRKKK